jgi:hypothetical protein
MSESPDSDLLRAERAVEYVIRTRGHSSLEYLRALRDYEVRLHLTMEAAESAAVPRAAAPNRQFTLKRPA